MRNFILSVLMFAFVSSGLLGCSGGGGGDSTPPSADYTHTELALKLNDIKSTLDKNPPSAKTSNSGRSNTILDLDGILWSEDETKQTTPEILNYYRSCIDKVAAEIDAPVAEGLRVWILYNHGFIVKTPSKTFAFDLVNGKADGWSLSWDTRLPTKITDQIDVLFVSHEHNDHYDVWEDIPARIKAKGGQVVYPEKAPQKNNTTTLVVSGQTFQVGGLTVTATGSYHSAVNLIYEVSTPEGYKIVHTGDTSNSLEIPATGNVDILLINGWINGGVTSPTATNLLDMTKALERVKPVVMVPGHLEELSHYREDGVSGAGRYKYTSAVTLQDDPTQTSKTVVLTWGEKLDYKK